MTVALSKGEPKRVTKEKKRDNSSIFDCIIIILLFYRDRNVKIAEKENYFGKKKGGRERDGKMNKKKK